MLCGLVNNDTCPFADICYLCHTKNNATATDNRMEELSNSVSTLAGADMYEYTEELDTRGFNRLWSTIRHGRRFLLKGLKPEYLGKPEFEALLRKEFELAIRLDHPSIVRVWGMEHLAGKGNCILMDYIEGVPLSTFMEAHPAQAERLRIAREVAESLAYIHTAGVWHRDLKPDNIMVTRSGRHVRLIDFGLGDSDDFVCFKGSGATRTFGAPEQTKEHRGDSRSDVYSFGRLMQYLHLPLRYAYVTRKCLLEDPDRRPSMENVLKSMKRAELWRWRVTIPVSAGIVAMTAAIVLSAPSKREPVRKGTEGPVQSPPTPPADTGALHTVPARIPAEAVRPAAVPAGTAATGTTSIPAKDRDVPAGRPDMDAFEMDYKTCLGRVIDEGTPYIKQYVEARKQGKEESDAGHIRAQAYEVFSAHWVAFITKWAQNGKSPDELNECETAIFKEVNGRWGKLMEEVDSRE